MIIKFYIHLFQVKHLLVYQKFHQQMLSFLKTFKSKFQEIDVWFTDQNNQTLEIE